MNKIIKLATEMSAAFETKTRENGEEYIILKDGSPDWMRDDVIYPAHDDKLPDDTVYSFIEKTVDAIANCVDDCTENDVEDAIDEIEPDIYTSDLTAWLNARNDHVYYLTEALEEELGIVDGFQLLAYAQQIQIREIAYSTLEALKKVAENL